MWADVTFDLRAPMGIESADGPSHYRFLLLAKFQAKRRIPLVRISAQFSNCVLRFCNLATQGWTTDDFKQKIQAAFVHPTIRATEGHCSLLHVAFFCVLGAGSFVLSSLVWLRKYIAPWHAIGKPPIEVWAQAFVSGNGGHLLSGSSPLGCPSQTLAPGSTGLGRVREVGAPSEAISTL